MLGTPRTMAYSHGALYVLGSNRVMQVFAVNWPINKTIEGITSQQAFSTHPIPTQVLELTFLPQDCVDAGGDLLSVASGRTLYLLCSVRSLSSYIYGMVQSCNIFLFSLSSILFCALILSLTEVKDPVSNIYCGTRTTDKVNTIPLARQSGLDLCGNKINSKQDLVDYSGRPAR